MSCIKGWEPEIAARKERNVEIFSQTMDICRAGGYTSPQGKKIVLPTMEEVAASSRFYVDPPRVDSIPAVDDCRIDVVNGDCIDVARDLILAGYRPIMLNMADRHTPGGGVLSGCRAQEESLFRRSNLCASLYQYDDYHAQLLGVPRGDDSYPMDRNTGGIYSGTVTFFREGVRRNDELFEEPFTCAVVSVAAINSPDLNDDGRLVDWAVIATKSKIRTMLRIGLLHGHDAIVLSAWGCGAFHNPPAHMAELFHEVLVEPEFANKYRCVRFAIIDDHNSRHANFASFAAEFNGAVIDERDRIKGMLWGLIVGDCLGSPIQFSDKDDHPYITEMVPCPVFDLPAGYWTDDSSMAMCVMESYIRLGKYDLADIGNNFVRWYFDGFLSSADDGAFDVGNATASACHSICNGSLVNGAHSSQGNGSIMRFAPSYLIGRREERSGRKNAADVMHEISDLTHSSSRIHEVVDRFAGILDDHLAGKRTNEVSAYTTREEVNNSGWAVSTLEAALWAFNSTSSFEEGMTAAVNLGGDSDSIGSVYGQLAGAYYGFSAIPERWVRKVKTSAKVDAFVEDFLEALQ